MGGIDISKLKGLLKQVAENIDKSGNNNGFIDGQEVSIFTSEATQLHKQGKIDSAEYNSVFFNNAASSTENFDEYFVAKRDATYVAPFNKTRVKEIKVEQKDTYKNHPKYKEVSMLVSNQLVKRIPKVVNGKRAGNYKSIEELPKNQQEKFCKKSEYITKIVLEKCDKYEISDLAPVIAEMLGVETGGYVFEPRVMAKPGSQFKGVMQTSFEVCCSIYGKSASKAVNVGNNKTIRSRQTTAQYQDWHKRHYSQDDARINEIKKKYPTPEALYAAIQKDVELGLEVGILALKANLSWQKGSLPNAISKYCGNQYNCNELIKEGIVPSKVDVKDNVA